MKKTAHLISRGRVRPGTMMCARVGEHVKNIPLRLKKNPTAIRYSSMHAAATKRDSC